MDTWLVLSLILIFSSKSVSELFLQLIVLFRFTLEWLKSFEIPAMTQLLVDYVREIKTKIAFDKQLSYVELSDFLKFKMSIASQDNPSICPDCGYCAENDAVLGEHTQHWHGEVQRCPHCKFTSYQVKVSQSH
jgi:hypothetical protein